MPIQRVLDVVHRQRVAGEQHVDVAGADQLAEMAAPPVWTTTGPATNAMRPPLASRRASSSAIRATLASTRRSDEISLVMNAKPWRSRSRNSGRDADAVDAAHDRIAGPDVAQLAAQRPPVLDHHDRVHPLALDLDPLAAVPHRVCAGWSSNRSRRARSRPCPRGRGRLFRCCAPAAERDQRLRAAAAARTGRAVIRFADGRSSSLVRPMSKSHDFEGAPRFDRPCRKCGQELRVDEMPFGLDHFADWFIAAQRDSKDR